MVSGDHTGLAHDVACIEAELHMSRRNNGQLRSEAVGMRQDLAALARDINARVGTIEVMEKDRDRMQTIIDRYENQYALLKTKNDELLVEKRKRDRHYEMLKKDHGSISRINARMDDEAGALETTINELRELTDNYQDKLDAARLEIDRLKDESYAHLSPSAG